jgi:stage III sporulation protein AG
LEGKSLSNENKFNWLNIIKVTKDQWPFIFKLLTVAFIGIVILNFANTFYKPQKAEQPALQKESISSQKKDAENFVTDDISLEKRLETILKQIHGAGTVSATVVFAEGPTCEYAVNVSTTSKEIEEKDQNGGVRTTHERTENGEVVMVDGNQQPILVKESMPKIQGVLIVAQGADNPYVKEKLFNAVQTLLQVPAHRITVCNKNGG